MTVQFRRATVGWRPPRRLGFHSTAFAQETPEAASTQWRAVASQIRPKVPTPVTTMEEAEHDGLAYMAFLKQHRGR